jgi:hypothetical protein
MHFLGVRLSPLGTWTNNWTIAPAPDDRWWWLWSSRWNENRQGKLKYSEKPYPSVTLSTTNPTWPDLGSNTGRRTNRLSYGTGLSLILKELVCFITLMRTSCLSPRNCQKLSYSTDLNEVWNLRIAVKVVGRGYFSSTSILLYPSCKTHHFFCLNGAHHNKSLHDVKQRLAMEGALLSRIPVWSTCPLFIYNDMQNIIFMYVPYLRRSAAVFPPRRPEFEPRSAHVGLVVDKVILGRVFSEHFRSHYRRY